jgi:hypothetical protein
MRRVLILLWLGSAGAVAQGPSPGWTASREAITSATEGQPGFNYEESRVVPYVLPELLTRAVAGETPVETWRKRRQDLVELFREHVYGRRPPGPDALRFEVLESAAGAMNGAASLRRVAVVSTHEGREHRFEIVLFLPAGRPGPVPLFLLLNNRPVTNTDPSRSQQSPFWPAEALVGRGYGIAALQVGALAPDDPDRVREGVIRLFEGDDSARTGDAAGALAIWSWGASRALDYFETTNDVDSSRIAVVGHSRGGKAALWAGAEDERFAMVVSNDSGEGGAALARRTFGETTRRITSAFPHWFAGNYRQFADREAELPIDQHMLLALIAPRALYVASADRDLWADPRGEFLALAHSSPAYALFGERPIDPQAMPPLNTPLVDGPRGYHIREGAHDLTLYDWERFADFADSRGWNARRR